MRAALAARRAAPTTHQHLPPVSLLLVGFPSAVCPPHTRPSRPEQHKQGDRERARGTNDAKKYSKSSGYREQEGRSEITATRVCTLANFEWVPEEKAGNTRGKRGRRERKRIIKAGTEKARHARNTRSPWSHREGRRRKRGRNIQTL